MTKNNAVAATETTAKKTRTPLDKKAKLIQLANQRVPRAIRALDLIGALGKYQPSDEQVDRIHSFLDQALVQTRNKLMAGQQSAPDKFSL